MSLDLPAMLTATDPVLAAEELSWFAIRQPTVIRFLERRLWAPDGDAFALALDVVCRLHAAVSVADGLEPPRVSEALLREGLTMTPPASLTRWVAEVCAGAPVVLSGAEEAEVERSVAAVAWGFTAVRAADVGDGVVR